MNKKEINGIKRELKTNSISLDIKELYSVYLKKDNKEIIHSELNFFESLDLEKQELYYANFKKILAAASLDTKLFQLSFKQEESSNEVREDFQNILDAADNTAFKEASDKFVVKIGDNFRYEKDVVISFIRAQYWKGVKSRKSEGQDDLLAPYNFVLVSINSIELPKSNLRFDFSLKEFKAGTSMESIVNLAAPLEGMLFPVLNDGYQDINNIMYYAGKPKEIDPDFINEVFQCNFPITAKDEEENFYQILESTAPGKFTPEAMQHIYENLDDKMKQGEQEEEEVIDAKSLKAILEGSGVGEIKGIEEAFEELAGSKQYEFKIKNILPDFNSKSVKIISSGSEISISPTELSSIKQVRDSRGNRCLLIQVDEDFSINGIQIKEGENS